MESKFRSFIKRIYKTVSKTEMTFLPGQLAFFFVLSVIPLLALFGSIASSFGVTTDAIINLLDSILPHAVLELLIPVIGGETMNFNVAIFYISAFLLASNGTHSMIIASNTIYKVKNKDYLSRRIKALMMTIILVSLLLFIIVVPAFGDKIVSMLLSLIKSDTIGKNITILYNILKYPFSFLLIYFCIKLLYVLAPDKTIKSSSTTTGTLVTSIGWMVATEIYSIYVDVFARYNIFYGSLSNILILLLWVYILAYIFMLGMALNSEYVAKEEEE